MLIFEAVGLFARNMEIMVKFYRDVMGMTIDWDGGVFTSCKTKSGASFNLCERKVMAENFPQPLGYPTGINGTMVTHFEADSFSDVDKEYERLVQAGVKSYGAPTTAPWGIRSFFVSDPEGNLIEIQSGNNDTAPAQ